MTTLDAANRAGGDIAINETAAGTRLEIIRVAQTGAAGRIWVSTEDGDLILGDVFTAGEAVLDAGRGAIVDADAGPDNDVTAGQVALIAATGIGSAADPIETASLAGQTLTLALRSDAGPIHVRHTGTAEIGAVGGVTGITLTDSADDNSGQDHITVATTGPLTVLEPVANHDGGNMVLAAEGLTATADLTVQSSLLADGGNGRIELYAGDSIRVFGALTVGTAGTGGVLLTAATDYHAGSPRGHGRRRRAAWAAGLRSTRAAC